LVDGKAKIFCFFEQITSSKVTYVSKPHVYGCSVHFSQQVENLNPVAARTKTNKVAFIALLTAISSFSFDRASASVFYNTETYGAYYSVSISNITSLVIARTVSAASVADLLGLAGRGIASALGSIQLAALTPPSQPATAAWSPETTASVKPAARPSIAAAPSDGGVFGSVAIPFKRLAALKRLAPSLAEMNDGTAISCSAGKCSAAATAIKASFGKTSQASLRDKMNSVNSTVNHTIRYARDIDTYKVADYWASPSETLKRQQGDCEDFAILKMAALHAEGVDLKDMAVVVLFDQKRHFYHAVLSVSAGGNHFILDNMRDEVVADSRLPDYMPLYSIAGGKGFLHGSRVGGSQMASTMPIEKVAPGEGVAF
jgi:predicted transglutaminase-like cysteine proteinase